MSERKSSRFIIERKIPIPKIHEGVVRQGLSRSILSGMKVGDSVVVDKKTANTLRNGAAFLSIKTIQRKVAQGQYRIWRIR